MRNLLILLVIVVASYQLYTRYQSDAASAYDEYGNPQTLLFTMNGCKPCDDARQLLKKRGVEFEEFNVSDGEAQAGVMKSYGGRSSFPYLVSGNQTLSGFYRHQVISTLAEVYGDEILTRRERKLMAPHFDAAGNARVVMYATERCGYCAKTRAYFNDEGIKFTEFDIDRDAAAKRNFKSLEAPGTPLVYVGYRRIDGFNRKKLDQALLAYQY